MKISHSQNPFSITIVPCLFEIFIFHCFRFGGWKNTVPPEIRVRLLWGSVALAFLFLYYYLHTFIYINNTRKEALMEISAITTILGRYLGLPLSLCGALARQINEKASNNGTIYSVKVSEQIYQVFFKADNIYYTHCYHETVSNYDSGGHLIDSQVYRYERVGG